MARQGTLEKARGKPSLARAPKFPALACVAALLLICAYSAFAIHRLIASNAPPTVTFTLGTAYRDVTYCNSQTLDVFVPAKAATRPLPLAIFVHGGGLTGGDKGYLKPAFLSALARAGFAVASLNYRLAAGNLDYRLTTASMNNRLAPGYQFPAQIEDVKCGIRYLRAHAQRYDVNPGKIFAFGTSYGGTLAALAALTGGHSKFDAGPYPATSSAIAAAVDMFGPADLPGWISPQGFHVVFGGSRAKLVLASPVHYVKADAPPILIVQGTADTTVPPSQSAELYRKLSASGDPTQLILVQHMGHMFAQVGSQPIDPGLTQIAAGMVSWFQQHGAGS
jgi:acetyl esterase/lipase